jgi:transcriptional regulator with XRE-family HTH domain
LVDEKQFFAALGERVKKLRRSKGFTQEDMIGFGFSARHWQQIEAGRPITVTTLLRICDTFAIRAAQLIEGLDRGIYRK